jgi:hypothetical protein
MSHNATRIRVRPTASFAQAKHAINERVEAESFGDYRIELSGKAKQHTNRILEWAAWCGVHNLSVGRSRHMNTIAYTASGEACTISSRIDVHVGNGITWDTTVEDGTVVSSIFVPHHFI